MRGRGRCRSRSAWPSGGSCAGLAGAVERSGRFVSEHAGTAPDACLTVAVSSLLNPGNVFARPRDLWFREIGSLPDANPTGIPRSMTARKTSDILGLPDHPRRGFSTASTVLPCLGGPSRAEPRGSPPPPSRLRWPHPWTPPSHDAYVPDILRCDAATRKGALKMSSAPAHQRQSFAASTASACARTRTSFLRPTPDRHGD